MNAALESPTNKAQPHVIIVGGGFGGLAAARALKDAPVRVILSFPKTQTCYNT
jgi:cation diffusion facilitator CzcD-associated flavoprotein CzcO